MEQNNERPRLDRYRWYGIITTIISYFGIKYGVAAQYYGVEETSNFFYSLVLILACVFIGRAVEHWMRSRNS